MEQSLVGEGLAPYFRFRDEFAKVLDPRTHTIGWLDAQVWSGIAHVWGDEDSCIVAEIRQFPTGAFEVHVLIAAGDVDELVNHTIRRVEQWARDLGALFVTISSRAAWAKIMQPHGYEHWQTEIRKVL